MINEMKAEFEGFGYSVSILNSLYSRDWASLSKIKYDVIVLHADDQVTRVKNCWPNSKLIVVTHYGLASERKLWHSGYEKSARTFAQAEYLIVLNQKSKMILSSYVPPEKIIIIPNGSNFTFSKTANRSQFAVCIGKVEERKRQFEVASTLQKSNFKVDFVGPVVDERFKKFPNFSPQLLGSKSKNWISQYLPSYRVGILMSMGEGDALVLYEYQLAGLEVVCTAEAAGSQDESLPWVHICTLENIESILTSIDSSPDRSESISHFAQENYSWSKRISPYKKLIDQLCKK